MKEDGHQKTTIHRISPDDTGIIITAILISVFKANDNEKLLEYVMKEDESQLTPLHLMSKHPRSNENVIQQLLSVFDRDASHGRLIEYLMKEDQEQNTALHYVMEIPDQNTCEKMICSMLDEFNGNDKENLIKYLTKVNAQNQTAEDLAHYPKIKKLLSQTLFNVNNENVLSNLASVTHIFVSSDRNSSKNLWNFF